MRTSVYVALASGLLAHVAVADGDEWEEGPSPPPPYTRTTAGIGGVTAATTAAPAYTTSARIAIEGNGALVIDADSGNLLRTDERGASSGQLQIGADAGLLAFDPIAHRAYVADRGGDRVVVVDVGEKLAAIAAWKTPAEPYGVALAPDRKTLFVTTIADRTLVAFDVAKGAEAWRAPLGAEPRGIAISPDGSRAVVASLATGTLEQFALGDEKLPHRLALPTDAEGQRARGAFTVAFVGSTAVAPYQLETPVAKFPNASDHYGGSFAPPVGHDLAWFAPDGERAAGVTNVNEPRALAWDAARDILYVAGLASDQVVQIPKASQVDGDHGTAIAIKKRCGADGLAVTPAGDVLVWCSFTRTVARFERKKTALAAAQHGPELVASKLDATHHDGLVLFHTASSEISVIGGMSCGNCHLDGRADGLSWKIGKHELQTPMLAGRLADTAPFKWDGGAADLPHSLAATLGRLGGTGMSKKKITALATYLESMPAIRTPTRDAGAVARGKKLFDSEELGCALCHDGPKLTDRERHEFGKVPFDTPSLIGLAASAPYFHDGSAATLEAALRDRGRVHGMSAAATKLSAKELADLVAFLETL